MTRERDQVESVVVNLGGEDVTLRLNMAALADFERAAGITVPQFLQPVVRMYEIIAGDSEASLMMQTVAAGTPVTEVDGADAAGWRILEEVLSSDVVSAKNLMIFAWALAGGEDREETPREFGRRIGIVSGRELVAGIIQAVKNGMPAAEESTEDEDADTTDKAPEAADPTTGPE